MLPALLDETADSFDSAVGELGRMVDHLRQVGLRGFIAEHTNDETFSRPPRRRRGRSRDEAASGGIPDETVRDDT